MLYHDSVCRTFKDHYLGHVRAHLRGESPRLPSDNRFVEQIPTAFAGLAAFLPERFAAGDGLVLADSTALRVCHNARTNGHRVIAVLAARGKASTGWF
jgi:hypothetical protein